MEFTVDQKKIIEARNCNLLVSAAAGSGKTAVLVERILQLITDEKNPADIDTLLVVTFTRAAAAQMREKISKAINSKLELCPDDINLQRQAVLVHNAQIVTIDSFCQYVLRNSFADIDLDPGFRLADEGEMKLLMQDTCNDYLEELYAKEDADFEYMAESLAYGAEDASLNDIILKLYDVSMSDPWPKSWLTEHIDDYEPVMSGKWMDSIMKQVAAEVSLAVSSLSKAIHLSELPAGPYMYCETLEKEYEQCNSFLEWIAGVDDYDEIRARIESISFDRIASCRDKAVNTEIKDKATDCRKQAKEIIKNIQSGYFNRSRESVLEQMERCKRVLKKLVNITIEYIDRLDTAKKDKGLLSFADCEHLALDILVSRDEDGNPVFTDTAREYRKHFSYVMIDEYQDSNMIQELILAAVSGEEDGYFNRFMVGDVKQSIYRFRQADPSIFMDKYCKYDENGTDNLLVNLSQNFRSRSQVLDATNSVFSKIMTQAMGGVDYNDKAALFLGARYPEAHEKMYETEYIAFAKSKDSKLSAKELESKGVAARIEQLMSTMEVACENPEDGCRKLKYGDIVILLRAANSEADIYRKALETRNIPVHVTGSEGYFTSYEIQTLCNLLRIIDNPLQDIYFYGVCVSIIGDFTPEDLAYIRILYTATLPENEGTKEGYLYKAFMYVRTLEDEALLRNKVCAFMDMLEEYRQLSEYMSVEELLTRILKDTDYRALISAMRGGKKRLANVNMLISKASDYAKTSYFGLYNFLRYIDILRKYEIDISEAETIDENADVVRIMSIHKSKGLEFPVCIVSGMTKNFNKKELKSNIVIDHELGIGIKDVDPYRRVSSNNLRRISVVKKIEHENMSEEMRVLYVAMTRAKEKLILTGTYSDENSCGTKYEGLCADDLCPEFVETADSFSDWIEMSISDNSEESSITTVMLTDSDIEEHFLVEDISISLLASQLQDTVDKLSSSATEVMKPEEKTYFDNLFNSTYPFPDLSALYTKTSVSELKHAAMPEDTGEAFDLLNLMEQESPIPKFISGTSDKPGATVRGSAFHRAMELLDFDRILHERQSNGLHKEFILSELDKFTSSGRMSPEGRKIFNSSYEASLLLKLFNSSEFEQMAAADKAGLFYRETPFLIGLPASVLNKDFPDTETVLVQGIIDAYWYEDGEAVILDYKTDRVSSADKLISLYKTQLDYYQKALEQMNISVKKKIIYSFALSQFITLT